MVFCYQNCSDLLWGKKCSCDQEKLLKFEAEGREFAKYLRSLEQFIQTVKGHTLLVSLSEHTRDKPFLLTIVSYLKNK